MSLPLREENTRGESRRPDGNGERKQVGQIGSVRLHDGIIDDAKVSVECETDGNYELEHFDNFVCRILATYADEKVLNEKGKIDYRVFKPALFEFPTYEYFVTGDKIGDCGKMNSK